MNTGESIIQRMENMRVTHCNPHISKGAYHDGNCTIFMAISAYYYINLRNFIFSADGNYAFTLFYWAFIQKLEKHPFCSFYSF